MSKVHVFGRHKIGQPEPTKVLLFIHSSRKFPRAGSKKAKKKFQMPALHDHLQLRFCMSKVKIKLKQKVNIAHFKSCWRRNFLLHLLMSKCEAFFCLWQEPTGRQVTPWAHSLLLHLKKEYFFSPTFPLGRWTMPKKKATISTHLSQVSRQEHTKVFFFFSVSQWQDIEREHHCRKRKVLGVCCGFKGNSKPAKVAEGKKKKMNPGKVWVHHLSVE